MALIEDEPPITLPRAHLDTAAVHRFLGLGVVAPVIHAIEQHLAPAERQLEQGMRSHPPASSSRTRVRPSALNRLASVQPAEPAPMMM